MELYELRDALAHTGVTRNILIRWIDAGILRPGVPGEGHGSRRRFEFRDLIAICVLRDLRALGAREGVLKAAIDALRRLFNKEIPADGSWGRANVLWIGLERLSFPPDETIHDVPVVTFTDFKHLADRMYHQGQSGTAINLDIIAVDLERRTGETIFLKTAEHDEQDIADEDFVKVAREKLREALGLDQDDQDDE